MASVKVKKEPSIKQENLSLNNSENTNEKCTRKTIKTNKCEIKQITIKNNSESSNKRINQHNQWTIGGVISTQVFYLITILNIIYLVNILNPKNNKKYNYWIVRT